MAAVEASSERRGDEKVNLALLTDGLRAEREQGITIDVGLPLLRDTRSENSSSQTTPGHIQYTRNMVTGASTADLAIILIDARHGVVEQTCRHSFIANLLRIQHVVLAVNKMDLVDYSEEVYTNIVQSYKDFASRLDNIVDMSFIPMSALNGDNVVEKSENMPWYQGASLLYHLETVYVGSTQNHVGSAFPRCSGSSVPSRMSITTYRGYAGRVAGGVFKPGDEVQVLPSGFHFDSGEDHICARVIWKRCYAPLSASITLANDIDISRGDMIVKPGRPPKVGQDIEAMICWFSEKALVPRGKILPSPHHQRSEGHYQRDRLQGRYQHPAQG